MLKCWVLEKGWKSPKCTANTAKFSLGVFSLCLFFSFFWGKGVTIYIYIYIHTCTHTHPVLFSFGGYHIYIYRALNPSGGSGLGVVEPILEGGSGGHWIFTSQALINLLVVSTETIGFHFWRFPEGNGSEPADAIG